MRADATARELVDPRTGASFRFDAGAHCLDFAHSGGEGPYAVFESLHRPSDLAEWFAGPPLGAVLTEAPTELDLVEAKALRQAIWMVGHAAADGRPPTREDVATINRAARSVPPVPHLGDSGTSMAWAAPVTASQVLSFLARDMIELLSGPMAGRIRECASDNCPLVFVDTSRPGARRWCAMERCGNRHKQRARRTRRAGED